MRRMFTEFIISATTCTSGALIGTTTAITRALRNGIRKDRRAVHGAPRAVVHGGIILKLRAAGRVPTFRRNSTRRLMDFASRAPLGTEEFSCARLRLLQTGNLRSGFARRKTRREER